MVTSKNSDYETLRYFLKNHEGFIPKNYSLEQSNILINKYIGWFCQIHIQHIQATFPPAKLYSSMLGDNTIGRSMIVRKVIEDLQKADTHITIGDLYYDAFQILAPGIDKNTIPKIHPTEEKKKIIDLLMSRELLLKHAKHMSGGGLKKGDKIQNWILFIHMLPLIIPAVVLMFYGSIWGLFLTGLAIFIAVTIKRKG